MKQGLLDIKIRFIYKLNYNFKITNNYLTEDEKKSIYITNKSNKELQGIKLNNYLKKKSNCYQYFKKDEHLIMDSHSNLKSSYTKEYAILLKQNIDLFSVNVIELEILDFAGNVPDVYITFAKKEINNCFVRKFYRLSLSNESMYYSSEISVQKLNFPKICKGDKIKIIFKENNKQNIIRRRTLYELNDDINNLQILIDWLKKLQKNRYTVSFWNDIQKELKNKQIDINKNKCIIGTLSIFHNDIFIGDTEREIMDFYDNYILFIQVYADISINIITERQKKKISNLEYIIEKKKREERERKEKEEREERIRKELEEIEERKERIRKENEERGESLRKKFEKLKKSNGKLIKQLKERKERKERKKLRERELEIDKHIEKNNKQIEENLKKIETKNNEPGLSDMIINVGFNILIFILGGMILTLCFIFVTNQTNLKK